MLKRDIGDAAFELISAKMKELFVGACDQESFILWRRDPYHLHSQLVPRHGRFGAPASSAGPCAFRPLL